MATGALIEGIRLLIRLLDGTDLDYGMGLTSFINL